jgi:hypothetical protein
MNTHMRIVANLAIAASGLMLQIIGVAPGAVAQELEIQRPEPAQNLWDVRATPGVPQLTFTSPSSSAHAFPTLEGSTTPRSQLLSPRLARILSLQSPRTYRMSQQHPVFRNSL